MALVAIEEQHLYDIGDALRSVYGETREEDVYTYCTVLCTDGATGFGNINKSPLTGDIREKITFSGASSIAVKMSYYDSGAMWFSISGEEMPSNTDESAIIEKTFDGDTANFIIYVSLSNASDINFGLYAEIYGYDADGNPVPYSVSTENVKNTYKPREIAPAVKDLCHIPEETFLITGNCQYRFANGGWDWFIEQFGDKITTENINNAVNMFVDAKSITKIPFEFNFVDGGCNVNSMFGYCTMLESVPSIDFKQTSTYKDVSSMFVNCQNLTSIGTIKNLYPSSFSSYFASCYRLRELPAFENVDYTRQHSYNYANVSRMFDCCYSLRRIPIELLKELYTASTSIGYQVFYYGFNSCNVLDELVGLPVNEATTITSNMFSNTFDGCRRLKSIVFGTNDDGSVKTANWKAQTINLAGTSTNYAVGMSYLTSWITDFNSGITEDTLVTDDATYQALKDNPDWWTKDINYSRYNHDSAVETINSLPDTSAYLATAGGTNTIKFRGEAGANTDGGAINTLTEEEIAVATAKGWTVSLV